MAKVKGEWDMLLLDMTVFHSRLHEDTYNGVSNTGNGYMGLNTGFVKAGSHFAPPLNLAANLATGDGAWLPSSQT